MGLLKILLKAQGLGSVLVFAGCVSSVQPLSVEASASYRADFNGEVKVDEYDTSAGEYQKATWAEHAKNVSKPIKPNNSNENSVAGLYASVAFYVAATQYMMESGDDSLIEQTALNETDKSSVQSTSYQFSTVWFEEPKVTANLTTPQPEESGGEYTWPSQFMIGLGSFVSTSGRSANLSSSSRSTTIDVDITSKYENGHWVIGRFATLLNMLTTCLTWNTPNTKPHQPTLTQGPENHPAVFASELHRRVLSRRLRGLATQAAAP